MGIVVVSIVLALLAALLAGGRFSAVESLPVRGVLLLLNALLAQVAGLVLGWLGAPAGLVYAISLAVSAALVTWFLVINRSLAGTVLVATGLMLNALVVATNGAMPVSAYAAARAGAGHHAVTDQRHERATSATHLRILGDVIPVPMLVRPEVVSPGDLLVAAGLAQMAFMAIRPYRRRRSAMSHTSTADVAKAVPAARGAHRRRSTDRLADGGARNVRAGRRSTDSPTAAPVASPVSNGIGRIGRRSTDPPAAVPAVDETRASPSGEVGRAPAS